MDDAVKNLTRNIEYSKDSMKVHLYCMVASAEAHKAITGNEKLSKSVGAVRRALLKLEKTLIDISSN